MSLLRSAAALAKVTADIISCGKASPAQIAVRQERRLAELIAFARANSPFYQIHYASVAPGTHDITRYPHVRKPELMANFDRWVTDAEVNLQKARAFARDLEKVGEPFLDKYLLCTTSGTTGEPALLLHDDFDLKVGGILGVLRSLPTYLDGYGTFKAFRHGVRAAMFSAGGGHFSGVAGFKRSLRRQRFPMARFGRFINVLDPMAEQIAILNEFKPTILLGYPSAIWLAAQEQRLGRLQLAPHLIVPMGETISDTVRRDMEQIFDCPVRASYGSSECFSIANECHARRLHLNADWVIVEAVDRDFQPVPPGTPSHTTLITNLANRVQPFIRYDLGDVITLHPDPCPCGRMLPTVHVQGRSGDLLRFPGADAGTDVLILPLAFETVIEETPGVHRFQAIQSEKGLVRFKLEVEEGATRALVWKTLLENIAAFLAAHGAHGVRCELLDELPRTNPKTGKFKQIEVWRA